jgi:hypothetical protein
VSLIDACDYDAFLVSARAGCQYCDLVCQAYVLLGAGDPKPPIDIRIYKSCPADITLSEAKGSPVVEIYACSGT